MIGKTKKGQYYFRVYYIDPITGNQERKYLSGFSSKKEAKQREQEFLFLLESQPSHERIFHDIAMDYLLHREPHIQETSHKNNLRNYRIYIAPIFKNKKIGDIQKLDCRRWADNLYKINKSSKTKNEIIRLFKAIFTHADEYYDLKLNPSKIINRAPKDSTIPDVASIWSVAEFEKFISYFDESNEQDLIYKTFFTVAFWTGMRRGELQALQLGDIDHIKKTIRINKSVTLKFTGQGPIIKSPKTNSSIRTISIDNNTYNLLNKLISKRNYREPSESEYVFCRIMMPYIPIANTTVANKMINAIKVTGVKRIRLHDLRHSHASILIGNGVNIVAVSKRLGHSSIDMTLKVYTHVLPTADQETITMINSLQNSANLVDFSYN